MSSTDPPDFPAFDFAFHPVRDATTGKLALMEVQPFISSGRPVHQDEGHTDILFNSLRHSRLWPGLEMHFYDQALSQAPEWLRLLDPDVRLVFALNIQTASQDDFTSRFIRILDSNGINPGRIQLQLREPELLSNKLSEDLAWSLATAGLEVSVDSFLADNSNFDILSHPHIRTIKCDRGLIEAPLNRQYLAGLVSLSGCLDKQIVLDGIDTECQLEMIREIGSPWYQGWQTGGPVGKEELPQYLSRFGMQTG